MQQKFTLKNIGSWLKFTPLLLMLLSLFAGKLSAQCTWTASTVLPQSSLDMPAATVGTNLYTFGGVRGEVISALSSRFDGTTWTAIANLPAGLEFASAVSDGSNIYIMGGALEGTGVPQTTNYRYNVATNTYTTLAPCTVGTWNHAAVFLNGKIYKIGGSAAAAFTATVEIYDIATNIWTLAAPYPATVGLVGATVLGGFIYTAGGVVANAGSTKTYRYDPAANTWDDASIADLPATRWGAAASNYRNGFVLAGGYAGGDVTANISTSVITWNFSTNTWSALPNLIGERARFTGAILNDNFFVLGGQSITFAAFQGTDSNQRLTCPPLPVCTGTPAPGNTFASSNAVCVGTSVTLRAQNVISGTGVTYQWQSATDVGGPYVNAPGTSTNPTYITIPTANAFYQVVVTCGANSGTSTPTQVSVSPCSCITPDVASICEGTIQRLRVNGAPIILTFNSTIPVTIPSSGNGTPYPTTIEVTGVAAGARVRSITLRGITHTFPADIDVAVVSPTATPVILMSDAGGGADIVNVNYTFNDAASAQLGGGFNPSGTYRPTNLGTTDNFPTPGPGSLTQATPSLSNFTGNVNGNWNLYLVDDDAGDFGSLTGWSIVFEVFPVATWTGGQIFTDPAATIPYIAGSPANTVWVMPSVTTTYTANIAAGPCAGANNVTVNVLPRPVVTVSPAVSCGPSTLTAAGAVNYSWTPAAGLNMTTGPTVIANPLTTTTYTVVGTANNGCTSAPAIALVNAAPSASVIAAVAGSNFQISEGFTTVLPSGWAQQNRSEPVVGTTNWFQGAPGTFPAFNGPTNSYAAANFQNVAGTGTISNWLFTPVVNIKNGDVVSFYTRTTDGTYADRLEVRLSTNGASTNVGTTATSAGDFTTLIYTVNPNLATGSGTGVGNSPYPTVFTRLSATVSGITGTVTGRVAFRYFVTDGGLGSNSEYIGIDQVEYSTPASVNCANVVTNIKIDITGGVGPYTVVFNNGSTNTTINGYTSGSNIQVSPSATTTYTIISVTGANGCVGTGNSGSAVITITPPPAINTQPLSVSVCTGNTATFTIASTPATGNTVQWQESVGTGPFVNLTNTAPYSGVTTNTLTITGVSTAQNGNRYRAIVTGACPAPATSNIVTLTVNTAAVITTQPVSTSVCATPSTQGTSTTFTVAATGNALTFQWQVSTDGGTTYTNIANGAPYSGATTNTLTVSGVGTMFNNYLYRVLVTTGGCTATTSNAATLTIKPATVVVLRAAPNQALFPGLTTTLTAAVSPSTATSYMWFRNGILLPQFTGNTIPNITVDGLGTYSVNVTDANGCGGVSNAVTIRDSANANLFIYPSPNTGQFSVRFFNDPTSADFGTGRRLVIFDNKGSQIYTKLFAMVGPYVDMRVDLRNNGKGIYSIDLLDSRGNRLKTGRVLVL